MMGLVGYVGLGFRHIADFAAMDHLLFLVALVAPYRVRDWRHLLLVASAFTVGHSLTLALAVTDVVRLPTALIEFLIPVTIILAAAGNLLRRPGSPSGNRSALLALGFGLIHGAGFANFLRSMFEGSVAGPLVAFNTGIELGQVLIVMMVLAVFFLADRALTLRIRAAVVSLAAACWALVVAAERAPW